MPEAADKPGVGAGELVPADKVSAADRGAAADLAGRAFAVVPADKVFGADRGVAADLADKVSETVFADRPAEVFGFRLPGELHR